MAQDRKEFQEVRCKAHPAPRPIRDTAAPEASHQQAFNLDPIPFHRTMLEAVVFIGCMAAIGLLMIVFGGAA